MIKFTPKDLDLVPKILSSYTTTRLISKHNKLQKDRSRSRSTSFVTSNIGLPDNSEIMSESKDRIKRVRDTLGTIPDFPKPGIVFRDIFPVLGNASVFADLNEVIYEASSKSGAECVVGLESRGFLFGPILAQKLGVPFVPIRKKGKLPGEVISQTYELEYGTDCCEIQKGSVKKGQKVLVIDDLLATGGTMKAACDLLTKLDADIVLCLCVIELTALKGKERFDKPFISLITFDD